MTLMWSMNKPLWGTWNAVIFDSGFYVLKGFIGMYDRVVYGSEVLNKRIYWTSVINVYKISPHFER